MRKSSGWYGPLGMDAAALGLGPATPGATCCHILFGAENLAQGRGSCLSLAAEWPIRALVAFGPAQGHPQSPDLDGIIRNYCIYTEVGRGDGARVAALLDIRQMIGARSEPQECTFCLFEKCKRMQKGILKPSQERLTHILMDHDLHPQGGDYLIPSVDSPLWQTLKVPDTTRKSILERIARISNDQLSQRVCWSGDSEIWASRHS